MKNPVGKARSEPNHSPYLPPPTGRISWTWNPFKMIVRPPSKPEPTDRARVETEVLHALLLHLLRYYLHRAGPAHLLQPGVVCDREYLLTDRPSLLLSLSLFLSL